MRLLKGIGIALTCVYIAGCVLLYFLQDKLIFQPYPLSDDYIFETGQEVEVEVDENVRLSCLYVRQPSSRGVILFLHGTRGHNARCYRQTRAFRNLDYDIFMPDYRGYGKSDGKVSSGRQLRSDMQKVYDHLLERYEESEIVVAGYSLGTGIASYLASENAPKSLILIAPYVSIADLKNRRFPIIPSALIKYRLSNYEYLQDAKCKVMLFHGTDDEVIPFDSSERLERIDSERIRLVPLKGSGHRRSIFNDRITAELSRFLQ